MRDFEVNYIVNEEAGVVICNISDCECNAIAMIDKRTGLFSNPLGYIPEEFYMNEQYKGVARCAEGDTFDEEYGKKLAYRKAYLKYTIALSKKISYILKDYEKRTTRNIMEIEALDSKIGERTITAKDLYLKVLREAE